MFQDRVSAGTVRPAGPGAESRVLYHGDPLDFLHLPGECGHSSPGGVIGIYGLRCEHRETMMKLPTEEGGSLDLQYIGTL